MSESIEVLSAAWKARRQILAPQGLLRSSKYFYESNCLTLTFHTRILGIHSAYGLARKPDFKLLELATTIDGVTPDQSRRIGLFLQLRKIGKHSARNSVS